MSVALYDLTVRNYLHKGFERYRQKRYELGPELLSQLAD